MSFWISDWVFASTFGSALTSILAASTLNSRCAGPDSLTSPEEIGASTQCSCPATENRPALPTWTVIVLRFTSIALSWAIRSVAVHRTAQLILEIISAERTPQLRELHYPAFWLRDLCLPFY